MSIPTENINICFVGGVSTGKSTALNAVFGRKLTQCHFKRTTMVPTVYIENPMDTSAPTEIYDTIARKNQEIYQKTESGQTVSKDEFDELVFQVGKLDINIIENSFVNIYDIPGLNDPRTKAKYYEYLDSNFHKFNIIVFFVDIRSGLNTSDEFDILDFIANSTRNQIKQNDRKVFTLVVVNKADDMQLNVKSDEVMVTGELKEMFEHVDHTVTEEFQRREIDKQLIGIIPLCALDAYLYRMVQKFGPEFKLTPEQILKIGVNENGKKFSTKSPEEQEKMVYGFLQDQSFIDTMIKLSGFSQFEKMLQQFLVCANKIRVDNILFEVRKLPPLSKKMFVNFGAVCNAIADFMQIYNRIREIDEDLFDHHVELFFDGILQMFYSELENINSATGVIKFYDQFVESVVRPFFANYFVCDSYSRNAKDCVKKLLLKAFDKPMSDVELVNHFDTLKRVGLFKGGDISDLFDGLLLNPRVQNTIKSFGNHTETIRLMTDLPSSVDKSKILRFLIINQIEQEMDKTRLYTRYLIYRKYGDIPLADYIHGIMPRPTIKMVVDGLSDADLQNPAFALDLFYLNRLS